MRRKRGKLQCEVALAARGTFPGFGFGGAADKFLEFATAIFTLVFVDGHTCLFYYAGVYTEVMRISFWGAAQTVTGSMHIVETGGKRFVLDCGLYQGRRQEAFERNRTLPCEVSGIEAVMLSHAHIDHSGNLPSLVKKGYSNPIYTTPATADLCEAMLLDSAYLQEKDAAFVNKRSHRRRLIETGRQAEEIQPLYSVEDAKGVMPLFTRVPLHTPTEVGGLTYTTYEAGHMLGSSAMLLQAEGIDLVFSGDVGRHGLPILKDPEAIPKADYLIMESTYGDRLHQPVDSVAEKLASIVNRTAGRGGKIIVPAFAVGRTQQIVLLLHQLMDAHKIPSIPIFVDSPLAVNVTAVFRKHTELFDEETRAFLLGGEDPFGFKRLTYVRDVAASKALNDLRGPFMIVSASGMCEGGRILHHLRNNIADPRNTVLITGFQGEYTLGRKIVDRLPEVPIFGEMIRLRAEVAKINELSGHADQHELLTWMKPFVKGLKKVFLVHGELRQQQAMAAAIKERYALDVAIPKRGDGFDLG
jgi:metallo-beta-lactamase family protein